MYSKSCSVFLNLVALLLICTNGIQCAEPPEAICTSVGRVCSADCTKVLLCTIVGEEPIATVEECGKNSANQQTYCNSTSLDCSALEADCGNNQDVSVSCAAFGEFPNPTKCGSTVKCSEDPASGFVIVTPTSTCNCPNDKFVNLGSPNLPCSENACSYETVRCEKAGHTGKILNGTVFCYTCGVDTIFVHYCFDVKNWNFMDFSRANDGKVCKLNQ